MAIQYAAYNDDSMESGKFYLVEVDKDVASNLRLTTSITEPIQENSNKIAGIEFDMIELKDNADIISDNRDRINTLENRDFVKDFIHSLDVYSVKVNFTNKTQIVIDHNRKDIYYLKIMNYEGTVGNTENYQDVTSTVKITETIERNQQGEIIKKQIIIDSNQPITGYLLYI